jgi:hypothetical protein
VFLALFRSVGGDLGITASTALSKLFSAVDAYCADPELRDDCDIDDAALHGAVREFLATVGL